MKVPCLACVTCVTYGQVADSSCLEGSCGTCVEEHVMSVLVAGSSSLEESCKKHDLVVCMPCLEESCETCDLVVDTVSQVVRYESCDQEEDTSSQVEPCVSCGDLHDEVVEDIPW